MEVDGDVAPGAVTYGPPQKTAAALVDAVGQIAEVHGALHLPRVVMQAGWAGQDGDPVVIGVAAQEVPNADVVRDAEVEDGGQKVADRTGVGSVDVDVTEAV